jgi:ABC-2 type transport system permease protein
MRRYLRLLAVQLRASLQLSMQYRADFLIGCGMALFDLFWNLTPMVVVFTHRTTVAGWTFPEALFVIAWFTFLRGLFEGVLTPSLVVMVEHIRKGTLDFMLIKPADAQFLVSTARIEPYRAIDLVVAAGLVGWASHIGHLRPTPAQIGMALLLTFAGCAILYALAILVVCAAFFVVRLDNLSYLFQSIFDAARWPSTVFRGVFRFVFTFVIPLALMTTYPALALLGRLESGTAVVSIVAAALFVALSRGVWLQAIAHYRSASS